MPYLRKKVKMITASYLERDPRVADVHHLLVPHQSPVPTESANNRVTATPDNEGGLLRALVDGREHAERK